MVRAIRHFMEFCYIARRNIIDEDALSTMEGALNAFHLERQCFISTGVRADPISLPRQHSMIHYPLKIRLFGAPNGLCTSITESKHIKAVKEPWRRSNRFNALGQMLISNQRLDKLAAARADFVGRRMLRGTCLMSAIEYREQQQAELEETPGKPKFIENYLHSKSNCVDGVRLAPNIDQDGAQDVDDNLEGDGVVEGPKIEGEVFLSSNRRKYKINGFQPLLTILTFSHQRKAIHRAPKRSASMQEYRGRRFRTSSDASSTTSCTRIIQLILSILILTSLRLTCQLSALGSPSNTLQRLSFTLLVTSAVSVGCVRR